MVARQATNLTRSGGVGGGGSGGGAARLALQLVLRRAEDAVAAPAAGVVFQGPGSSFMTPVMLGPFARRTSAMAVFSQEVPTQQIRVAVSCDQLSPR